MVYLNHPLLEQYYHYVVTFDGRLDETRLHRAIRLAMDAEPVFGCRYARRRPPRWERRDDLDSLSLCQVVESADALDEFMNRPCDAAADPLIQGCILRGAADALCFKLSHVACDGPGGRELLTLIASLYRDLRDNPGLRVTPNQGSRSRMQLFRQYGWRKCLQALRKTDRRNAPRQSQWSFPITSLERRGVARLARRRLDQERFRGLRGYAKRLGATPTDVLVTAYFRTLWRFLDIPPGDPRTIFFPLDVRECLSSSATEAICNFTAPLYLTLDQIPGESFEATLRRVIGRMPNPEERRLRELTGALWISLAYRLALRRMQQAIETIRRRIVESGRGMVFLAFNGTFEPKHVNFGVPATDAYSVPPAAAAPGLFTSITSFRNSLSFTIRYWTGATRAEDVERFLDELLEELPISHGANNEREEPAVTPPRTR
jgi:NRPS condensation-like uncharacterized protein